MKFFFITQAPAQSNVYRIYIFNFKKQTNQQNNKNAKKAKETKEEKRISPENRLKETNLRPPE